jgi:predicted nucleic acid-binding protein
MDDGRTALLKKFVLDNSVVMSWCFEDEKGAHSQKILERLGTTGALVPALWPFELANVFWVAERRKRLSVTDAGLFLRYLSRFSIDIDRSSMTELIEGCLHIASPCHLTAYDAAYLYLAQRENLPLATFDAGMVKAAHKLNIDLL